MRQLLILLFILFFCTSGMAQVQPSEERRSAGELEENPQEEVEEEKPPITDYKIISIENDTIAVDTSLTLRDDYQMNYLRDDTFGLLPFSNVGQTYNSLTYHFPKDELVPQFGVRARQFNFFEVEDIFYYRVPTPFTELFFKTVFEQGQLVDSFFTVNTSPNLNFSVAYKGLRSLGKYQHILTSTGNFRATLNYHTNNQRYHLKAHYVSQDLMNQENGGLTARALTQYLLEEEEFEDRSRLDVNFENAQSTLFGTRFYLNHSYELAEGQTPSSVNGFSVGHILNFSEKEYLYEQSAASSLFGPSFENVNIRDQTNLEEIRNEIFLNYRNSILGKFQVRGGFTHFNYGYNSVLDFEDFYVGNRLLGNIYNAGASYAKDIGGFQFFAEGELSVGDDFGGNHLRSGISFSLLEDLSAAVAVSTISSAPNFNFFLYQSDYINYNWQNDFSNVNTQKIDVEILSPFADIAMDYTHITDHAFFALDENGFTSPYQYEGTINYFRAKAHKEFIFGVFAFDNTLLYQKVLNGTDVLNVPDFVARSTFYYHDHWFRRALYLQTGLTLNYFTDYHMDAYDPVLAEFYVQNEQEMRGFPRVDFFFNGKIRQARIFFTLEHVNSLLTGNNYFSAPGYPYRDFGVRFGVVWNFFL